MRLNLTLRTAVSLVVGLVITFAQAHTAGLGLTALASYGVGLALIGLLAYLLQRKTKEALLNLPLSALAMAVGLVAALAPASEALTYLRFLIVAWGLLSGAYELYLAVRTGRKTVRGKEQTISAILALILGAFYLAVPLRELDAVGFFGAYLIVSAVHLGIAAASERVGKSS
ncbi:MAG: hypothetical protein RJA35_904 [Actinomycetota bacterium]|jgi:uncharacterized membrane protein HdeD (DUF308 family)